MAPSLILDVPASAAVWGDSGGWTVGWDGLRAGALGDVALPGCLRSSHKGLAGTRRRKRREGRHCQALPSGNGPPTDLLGGGGGEGCAGWHMPEAPGPRAASPTAHGERGCRLSGGPSPGPDVLRAPEEERSCGPAPAGSLAGWPPPWFLRQLWRSAFSGGPSGSALPGQPPTGPPLEHTPPPPPGKVGGTLYLEPPSLAWGLRPRPASPRLPTPPRPLPECVGGAHPLWAEAVR